MVSRFSAKKEIYFPTKILKPEDRSWCKHFPPPSLQKSVLKTVQWNVIIIIIYILYDYYHCCCCCRGLNLLSGLHVLQPYISSLLQSATAFLLQSSTSVITKCDNFITKSDRTHVRLALWARFLLSKPPSCPSLNSLHYSYGIDGKNLYLLARTDNFGNLGSKRQRYNRKNNWNNNKNLYFPWFSFFTEIHRLAGSLFYSWLVICRVFCYVQVEFLIRFR